MDLIVRVRGVGDSSLSTAFRPLLAASAAAQRQVEADLGKTGKAATRAAAESAAAHKQAGDVQAATIRSVQALRDKDHARFLGQIKEEEAAQKKAAASVGAARTKAVEQASAALRTFGSLARTGLGTLGAAASGFGVDFSLQGGLSRGMQRNATAIALSNAAYKEGGPRESVAGLESQAMATGARYKLDPTGIIEGLAQYQKLTGDLATGKAGLDGLAALAGATTTKLDDMFAAAGNVGNALGEVGAEFKTPEEKAKAVLEVMKSVAAFGQEGAVEVSDLSKQMAKVAAAAGFFEGDRSGNLLKMTALAQLARQSGGAASATQAATSVLSFANILRTPARRAQFKEAGIDVDSATQKGQLRDPISIIKEALTKTGGAIEPMKKLFANVMGDKPVTALATAYNKAGGGDAGMKAVDAMLAKFSGTMSQGQIAANNAERMKGKEAEGIAFQIELDKVTSALGTELAPALKSLAPLAVDVAKGLAGIVSFGAQHPGMAITAAIVASIGKAALGETIGKAIGSAVGGISGSGGLVLGAATIAIAAASIAIQKYEQNIEKGKASAKGDIEKRDELMKTLDQQLKEGKVDPATAAEFFQQRAALASAQGQAALEGTKVVDGKDVQMSADEVRMRRLADDWVNGISRPIGTAITGGGAEMAGQRGSGEVNYESREKLDSQARAMDALAAQLKGILRVHVDNAADLRGPAPGPTPTPGSTGVH